MFTSDCIVFSPFCFSCAMETVPGSIVPVQRLGISQVHNEGMIEVHRGFSSVHVMATELCAGMVSVCEMKTDSKQEYFSIFTCICAKFRYP